MTTSCLRFDAPAPAEGPIALPRAGRQWLDVSAHVVERYLVTFRAPAQRLRALVPAPLSLDTRGGYGFVSVCALEMREMGIRRAPSCLRFDNLEFLYRVGVRFQGEPSFFTLRSDVSSPLLGLLGRAFSHYRPTRGHFELTRTDGFQLACRSGDRAGDARLRAGAELAVVPYSLFESADDAAGFLLGMNFSADVRRDGRVQTQHIDHAPWGARFVRIDEYHFDFLDRLERTLDTSLVFDHALRMRDLPQIWRAARCP